MFRDLKPDEIDVRVQSIKENGAVLLLYKDARCDMIILDETVGAMNWKREHTRENKNCIVSLWDSDKAQWISKEDTGAESMTEKEKGLASDSFKRACFNWGIGRELYTSPFIWVKNTGDFKQRGNKWTTYTKFNVSHIEIIDKKIVSLTITDDKGKVRFNTGNKPNSKPKSKPKKVKKISEDEILEIEKLLSDTKSDKDKFLKWLKSKFNASKIEDLAQVDYAKVVSALSKKKGD